MDQDPIAEISGNKRRRLWKTSCTAAALNVRTQSVVCAEAPSNEPLHQKQLTVTDRVLHAALAPSPQTLGVLTKEACKTWEDHLWARVSALCEEKLSEDMRLLGANFWEQGMKAFDTPSLAEGEDSEGVVLDEMRRVLGKMSELDVEEGSVNSPLLLSFLYSFFGSRSYLTTYGRSPGPGDPFHVTQLRVILDQADSLLDDFSNYLGSSELPPTAPELVFLCGIILSSHEQASH